jgi:hypothetical protein
MNVIDWRDLEQFLHYEACSEGDLSSNHCCD